MKNLIKHLTNLLAIILLNIYPVISQAQTFTTMPEFKAYILNFVKQATHSEPNDKIDIKIMQLDPKMKLPSCAADLTANLAHASSSEATNTVTLHCENDPEWALYIPVRIIKLTSVVVATHSLRPAAQIVASDLELQQRDANQLGGGFFTNMQDVIGSIATRSVPAGAVLSEKNLKQSPLVKKSQTVTLTLKHGAIEINMIGIAKNDGALHETIKILNPSSNKIVDAQVVGNGRVELIY